MKITKEKRKNYEKKKKHLFIFLYLYNSYRPNTELIKSSAIKKSMAFFNQNRKENLL